MIRCENLSHVYQKGTPFEKMALSDINLNIKKGELVAIIGHTGSGKSTLIQHFNALEKPSEGKVFVDGVDTSGKKVNLLEIRKKVGLVFQYPEHQLMEETVEKDIAFGPKNIGVTGDELKERVEIAAKMTGLRSEHLSCSPFELSGGEKRRVAIAGILAMEPECIVLDEPTAGLDPKGRDELLELIKKLNDTGMTVIIVSHSMEDVAKLDARVVVINDGRIALDGSVCEVFKEGEFLKSIGLDIPQITDVVLKLRKKGVNLPADIFTPMQAKEEILKLLKNKNAL